MKHKIRTYATLRMYSNSPEIDRMTDIIGISPSSHYKINQKIGKNKEKTLPYGYWELASQNVISSEELSDHIIWILNQIESKHEKIIDLQAKGVEMDIFCFFESAANSGFTLDPTVLRRIVELNLALGVDIYFAD